LIPWRLLIRSSLALLPSDRKGRELLYLLSIERASRAGRSRNQLSEVEPIIDNRLPLVNFSIIDKIASHFAK